MDLKNKIALITGAGRGIGRAIALTLAEHGADVVITARTQSDLDEVSAKIKAFGRKCLAIRGDVSIEDDVKDAVSRTLKEFGRIDVLVNNAGVGTMAPVVDMKTEDFDRMWATNMRGVFLFCKYVAPAMMKQKSGNIINISSLAGRNAFRGGAGYSATKWGLIGFSRSLLLEVREHNVRVITICPGSVDTDFGSGSHHSRDLNRMPKAADIAQVVLDVVQMPDHVNVSELDVRPTNPNW
ncbi:MAG TPA: SDR family NAD(P)-dependent oxidoreductase [Bacteroidota bacterium]|nr:SDR family NAD(P)-dependent oxidoreductase [Bacteroidota bacterium]